MLGEDGAIACVISTLFLSYVCHVWIPFGPWLLRLLAMVVYYHHIGVKWE